MESNTIKEAKWSHGGTDTKEVTKEPGSLTEVTGAESPESSSSSVNPNGREATMSSSTAVAEVSSSQSNPNETKEVTKEPGSLTIVEKPKRVGFKMVTASRPQSLSGSLAFNQELLRRLDAERFSNAQVEELRKLLKKPAEFDAQLRRGKAACEAKAGELVDKVDAADRAYRLLRLAFSSEGFDAVRLERSARMNRSLLRAHRAIERLSNRIAYARVMLEPTSEAPPTLLKRARAFIALADGVCAELTRLQTAQSAMNPVRERFHEALKIANGARFAVIVSVKLHDRMRGTNLYRSVIQPLKLKRDRRPEATTDTGIGDLKGGAAKR